MKPLFPFLLLATIGLAEAIETPKALDNDLQISLFAAEPDVVTPVGATVDAKGRLLIIESHTHFPPEGYPGPKTDRLRWIEDTDGDGKADRFRSFHEGGRHTMSLRAGPEGWIYVATRSRVSRLHDSDGDDKADQEEEIARLETKGDYPHNGLGGLAFDGQGKLYFGLGENIGFPYKVIGADGTISAGGGEGGNIYRCDLQGRGLERVATGFWNPFGICVDPVGRVFEVGNDPDSRPPCRLAHVVPGADFGYAFRYGRSGLHPLQAWNGELPGTLPMTSGTGEAPCNVIPWRGQLWVTIWGDNRIERYSLAPRGASFRASMTISVQGGQDFRPVDLAPAPDGSVYCTDWVDKSYPVHRKGRVWRLAWKQPPAKELAFPPLTDAEKKAQAISSKVDLEALKDPDPFLRQAAVWSLAYSPQRAEVAWDTLADPGQRLGLLQAHRWRSGETEHVGEELIPKALRDPDADVRLYAVRWIADRKLSAFRADLDRLLEEPVMTPALFQGLLAAMEWLDKGASDATKTREDHLARVARDGNRPGVTRLLAIRLLPPDTPAVPFSVWQDWSKSENEATRREAVRSLALRSKPDRVPPLRRLVSDDSVDAETRADAFVGLSDLAEPLDESLLAAAPAPLRREWQRTLAAPPTETKPPADDLAAWGKLLAGQGDPRSGWRVFFGAKAAACGACHAVEGRGNALGPDLTRIGQRLSRERLIESILQPSREIAPRYVPWVVTTKNGQTHLGFAAHQMTEPGEESYVGADGKIMTFSLADVASRQAGEFSIMPAGLEARMSPQDFRDLLAFLSAKD